MEEVKTEQKKEKNFNVKEMVEIAILTALAIVLDISGIKIVHASFTMVPLFIIAYRHGVIKGSLSILIYCIITITIDGWGLNPISFILDYLLGYGAILLSALFAKKIFNKSRNHVMNILWMIISILICSIIRILCSTLSGVIVWETPLRESFVVNLIEYVGWDCLFALIALPILYYPLIILNKKYPCSNLN